jgi:hypothetical protein
MDKGASGVVSGQLGRNPPLSAMGDWMCCVLPSMIVGTKPPRQPSPMFQQLQCVLLPPRKS